MGPVKWTKATELTAISNKLLEQCALKTYCDTEEAKKIVKSEGLDFTKIKVLNLEFKNILKMCNFWQFKNLTKLTLSNNVIEYIEGLEELTNLVYLDLSFNQIVAISGLDSLQNLTDLSLSSNKIEKVENLDNLKKLDILSLKDNQIDDFADVQYFFRFRSLRSVAFKGNPIHKDENYQHKVIAFIPSLLYLDFCLISKEMRDEAQRTCMKDLKKLVNADQIQEEAESARIEDEKKLAFHKEASLDDISESRLFNQLLNSHEQGFLLFTCPALFDAFNEFSSAFDSICGEWFQQGLKNYEKRLQEVKDFTSCTKRLVTEQLTKARKHIHNFQEVKQYVLLNMGLLNQGSADDEELESKLENFALYLKEQIKKYWKILMTLEMELSAQLNIIEDTFKACLTELIENFLPEVDKFHSQLQESYDVFMQQIKKFSADWCQKSEDEQQMTIRMTEIEHGETNPDTLELLGKDKSEIDKILEECFMFHTSLLKEKYESLQEHLKLWLAMTLNQKHEEELERHRQRVIEIMLYCRSAEHELEHMCKYCAIKCE